MGAVDQALAHHIAYADYYRSGLSWQTRLLQQFFPDCKLPLRVHAGSAVA
jgi:hypothetical protein